VTPPAPSAQQLAEPTVAVVAEAQTPPGTEEDAPAMALSAEDTRAGSGPPRRRAVGWIAVAALGCAGGFVLAWHTVGSPWSEIAAGISQSHVVGRPGEVAAEEHDRPQILEQPKISVTPQNTTAKRPATPAAPATPAPDDPQTTARSKQGPAPRQIDAARAAARARARRQLAAEKAVLDVLVAEQIGALVSQVKVTLRWTAAGEVTESTVDHLPRGAERTRVEARLRDLHAPAGPSEPLGVEKIFALELPE
jgi:hypothetical protein